MTDTNVWFYTLSAIPQTLAGMIALAAIFITFKLTYIKQTIHDEIAIAKWFLLKTEPMRYGKSIAHMSKGALTRAFKEETREFSHKFNRNGLDNEYLETLGKEFSDIIDGSHRTIGSHPRMFIFFLRQKALSLEKNVAAGHRIFAYLRWSIFFAVVPIVFSLILLPMVLVLQYHFFIIGGVAAIALSVWGIMYTSYSIFKISPI